MIDFAVQWTCPKDNNKKIQTAIKCKSQKAGGKENIMKTTFTFTKEDLENEFCRTTKIADTLEFAMQKVNYNEGYEDLYTLRYKFARKSTLIEYVLKALQEFPDLFTEIKENEGDDNIDDIDWDEVMEDLLKDLDEEEEA